jgi:hypothetical protein
MKKKEKRRVKGDLAARGGGRTPNPNGISRTTSLLSLFFLSLLYITATLHMAGFADPQSLGDLSSIIERTVSAQTCLSIHTA